MIGIEGGSVCCLPLPPAPVDKKYSWHNISPVLSLGVNWHYADIISDICIPALPYKCSFS